MSSYGINPEKISSYEGVFKTGLDVQNVKVDEQQLFDLNNSNALIDTQIDTSGLYKPSSVAGTTLIPTSLHPHGILEKADDTYKDENGKTCKVYKNDDGSYQIEKTSGLGILDRIFGNVEIEQYDANGNLVAKQKDGVTYYYDENGNLTKTSKGNMASGSVVLYNEDGSVKAESETQIKPNGEGHTTTIREYNEDGSYTQTVRSSDYYLGGTNVTTTKQEFDKNGNPISPAEEVDSNSLISSEVSDDVKAKIQDVINKLNTSDYSVSPEVIYKKVEEYKSSGLTDEGIISKLDEYTISEE